MIHYSNSSFVLMENFTKEHNVAEKSFF
jgi:hypothetical protein